MTAPKCRVWRYTNSDYTYQTAATQQELRALPWVKEATEDPGFHRLSVSGSGRVRAPWDRDVGLVVLMAEYDGGKRWHVLGGLEAPDIYGLPSWGTK
jgi:hypothetical protein